MWDDGLAMEPVCAYASEQKRNCQEHWTSDCLGCVWWGSSLPSAALDALVDLSKTTLPSNKGNKVDKLSYKEQASALFS